MSPFNLVRQSPLRIICCFREQLLVGSPFIIIYCRNLQGQMLIEYRINKLPLIFILHEENHGVIQYHNQDIDGDRTKTQNISIIKRIPPAVSFWTPTFPSHLILSSLSWDDVSLPLPRSLDYFSYVMRLKIRYTNSSHFLVLFKNCLTILAILPLQINLR